MIDNPEIESEKPFGGSTPKPQPIARHSGVDKNSQQPTILGAAATITQRPNLKKDLYDRKIRGIDMVLLLLVGLAVVGTGLSFYRANQAFVLLADLHGNAECVLDGTCDTAQEAALPPTEGIPANVKVVTAGPDDPVVGNENAPVTVIEFSDFQCPFCQRFTDTTKQIRETYGPDQVRFIYRDFPLTQIHPEAEPAAVAAQCVFREAGSQAFFDYHDQLFENQETLGNDLYFDLAANIDGLDQDAFASCVNNQETLEEVQTDLDEGIASGVTGTPATFVNGALVSGAVPFEEFKSLIDAELEN